MLRIGPAGWSYKDWEGIVYPAEKPRGFDQLAYLADLFNTIEINSTFYRPPGEQMARSWARRVRHNPNFKFTAKLWNRFTHEKEKYGEQEVSLYKRGIDPLYQQGLLGALLIQFPWSFKNLAEERRRLEDIIERFRPYPLVLEVRHSSWARPEVYEFLREKGVGFCNIDQPLIGKSIAPSAIVTSNLGYFRLHGRNYANWFRQEASPEARYDYLYSEKELDQLSDLIREIAQQAPETYVVTNNHYRGKGVANALELEKKLKGETPKIPPSLAQEYPRLLQLGS